MGRIIVHVHTADALTPAQQRLADMYEELARRMWRVRQDLVSRTGDSATWEEHEHPRAPDGRFGHKAGPRADAKETPKSGMHAIHALLSTGRPFTRAELLAATGLTDKRVGDYLAMLKNPKYAKPGVLKIERLPDGRYQVKLPTGQPAPPNPGRVREEWDKRFVRVQPPMPEAPRPPAPPPAAPPRPAPAPPPAPAEPPQRPKTWAPAKTAREATERAVREGWADAADFGRMSPEAANEYMSSVADHFTEFPMLRQQGKFFVGTNAGWKKHYVAERAKLVTQALLAKNPQATPDDIARHIRWHATPPRVSSKAWALAWQGGLVNTRAVSVNEKYSTDIEQARKDMQRSVDSGFHAPGCNTHKSTMDHEMGHQLDYLLGLRKHPEIARMYSEAMRAGVHREIPLEHQVSKYGRTNPAEFIAEAWAEAKNNPAPRPIARRVAEIIRSEYASRFGKPA